MYFRAFAELLDDRKPSEMGKKWILVIKFNEQKNINLDEGGL